jgi:hypothetical protein
MDSNNKKIAGAFLFVGGSQFTVGMIVAEAETGKVKTGYVGRGEVGTRISRADVADFMIKQVEAQRILQASTLNKQLTFNTRVKRERKKGGGEI